MRPRHIDAAGLALKGLLESEPDTIRQSASETLSL